MSVTATGRPRWLLAAALALALCGAAQAEPDARAAREIDHLLEFVGTSNCMFVRNGSAHPAAEAREHLSMKYRYARAQLNSAEDFVRELATGSSMSGEPYKIVCDRRESPAAAWLGEELARYRKAAPTPR